MKNIFKASLMFTGFLALVSNSYAVDFENITVIDNATITAGISDDVVVGNSIDADMKVLKDLLATYAYKDTGEAKKVIVNLTYELEANKKYSLLGIEGATENVDFTVSGNVSGEAMLENTEEIEKIVIADATTLEIYYKVEPEADEFMYKVLMDLGVESTTGNWEVLDIIVKNPLEELASYLLIINSFKDIEGKKVDFSKMFYEFDTSDNLEIAIEPQDLNAANDPSYSLNKEVAEKNMDEGEKEGNIEEVASQATTTPKTGAATWVLILATLGMSSFFFLKRRK